MLQVVQSTETPKLGSWYPDFPLISTQLNAGDNIRSSHTRNSITYTAVHSRLLDERRWFIRYQTSPRPHMITPNTQLLKHGTQGNSPGRIVARNLVAQASYTLLAPSASLRCPFGLAVHQHVGLVRRHSCQISRGCTPYHQAPASAPVRLSMVPAYLGMGPGRPWCRSGLREKTSYKDRSPCVGEHIQDHVLRRTVLVHIHCTSSSGKAHVRWPTRNHNIATPLYH